MPSERQRIDDDCAQIDVVGLRRAVERLMRANRRALINFGLRREVEQLTQRLMAYVDRLDDYINRQPRDLYARRSLSEQEFFEEFSESKKVIVSNFSYDLKDLFKFNYDDEDENKSVNWNDKPIWDEENFVVWDEEIEEVEDTCVILDEYSVTDLDEQSAEICSLDTYDGDNFGDVTNLIKENYSSVDWSGPEAVIDLFDENDFFVGPQTLVDYHQNSINTGDDNYLLCPQPSPTSFPDVEIDHAEDMIDVKYLYAYTYEHDCVSRNGVDGLYGISNGSRVLRLYAFDPGGHKFIGYFGFHLYGVVACCSYTLKPRLFVLWVFDPGGIVAPLVSFRLGSWITG